MEAGRFEAATGFRRAAPAATLLAEVACCAGQLSRHPMVHELPVASARIDLLRGIRFIGDAGEGAGGSARDLAGARFSSGQAKLGREPLSANSHALPVERD